MDTEEYLRRWSALHGQMDPHSNRLVLWWLTVVHTLARPLVAVGASPNAVTTLGLGVVVAAAAAAWRGGSGGGWPLMVAGLLVLLSGLMDNLDGAVAVMTGRTTRWGYVYDSLADRICDLLFCGVLWLAGAPAWWCLAVAALTMLQEYTRARSAAAGVSEIGVVSVWERPSRVLVTGMFTFAAGLLFDYVVIATIGAGVALLLSVVGTLQVMIKLRFRLRDTANPS